MMNYICSICKQKKHIVSFDPFSNYQLCDDCNKIQNEKEDERVARRWMADPMLLEKMKQQIARLKDSPKEQYRNLAKYNLKIFSKIKNLKQSSFGGVF